MKVYLLNPPASNGVTMVREGRCMQRKGAWTTVWPPVTLATIAAMLRNEGMEVRLDDCSVEEIGFDVLRARIAGYRPDLLVINTATASIYSDLKCAGLAKEASPGIRTACIGIHVTSLPGEAFTIEPGMDYVVRGEPEECVVELARALSTGGALAGIRGLSWKEDGKVRHNEARGFDAGLDSLPFPAWDLVDVKKYPLPLSGKPFLLITTSKGCPHSCLFCPAKPYYGSRLRLRDFRKAVAEMAFVKERFGVDEFLVWSETFTEDREYAIDFCREIVRSGLGVKWVSNSRVDKVDPGLLAEMKKAGCWMIGYGVESGVQEILDRAGKGTTVVQIEQAIRMAKAAGLLVTAHVLFGLPGETPQTAGKTVDFVCRQDLDFAQVYCAVPWPSTPLYGIAKEKGWLTSSDWEQFEQNNCVMDLKTISPAQVLAARRTLMRKFYCSPKRIARTLQYAGGIRSFPRLLALLKEFLTWM
jgi:anaerobic magnesium-protoporphyrin IX monomethyl ester cyclase